MKEPEGLAATTIAATPTMELSSLSDKVTATTEGLPPNCCHHLRDKVLCAGSKGKEKRHDDMR